MAMRPGGGAFADLRAADWLSALQDRLARIQRQAVEREAAGAAVCAERQPDRLAVDEPAKPPVLAARIQEMFGLRESPRVARRTGPRGAASAGAEVSSGRSKSRTIWPASGPIPIRKSAKSFAAVIISTLGRKTRGPPPRRTPAAAQRDA